MWIKATNIMPCGVIGLRRPWLRFVTLTIYYLGILVALVALYGQGNFSTPPFIYQNF